MFDKIKYNLAHFIIRKKYLPAKSEPISFKGIISNSKSFFVIMPISNDEFNKSLTLIDFLMENQKVISALIHESQLNLISSKKMITLVNYKDDYKNKLNLPIKNFVNELRSKSFDVVMDLNRTGDVFTSSITNIVRSKVRVGFEHEKTDNYYDIRIVNSSPDLQEIYNNYINFLKMF